MSIQKTKIVFNNGSSSHIITIKNNKGSYVEILSLGATIKSICVPDKDNKLENVLLEYKDINTYADDKYYLNSTIGRTTDRIYKGEITIKDTLYTLTKNDGGHNIDTGINGLNTKIWEIGKADEENNSIVLTTHLEHSEDGFPAFLNVTTKYTFTNDDTLIIEHSATASDDTVANISNNTYFNLSGNAKTDIRDQYLKINADYICEIDSEKIATGKLIKMVDHTAFDFTTAKKIGKNIEDSDMQIKNANGYEHSFVIEDEDNNIHMYDENSGRNLSITTTEKIINVNSMNDKNTNEFTNDKSNIARYGLCLKAQKFPIGHNQCFKNHSILRIGAVYRSKTQYKFYVR